jgi:hypothetical protein
MGRNYRRDDALASGVLINVKPPRRSEKPVRAGIFVDGQHKAGHSPVRGGIKREERKYVAPTELAIFCGWKFYKDVAPLALGKGRARPFPARRASADQRRRARSDAPYQPTRGIFNAICLADLSRRNPMKPDEGGRRRETGELLCVSATLVSPKSDEGGWRLGVEICRGNKLVVNPSKH